MIYTYDDINGLVSTNQACFETVNDKGEPTKWFDIIDWQKDLLGKHWIILSNHQGYNSRFSQDNFNFIKVIKFNPETNEYDKYLCTLSEVKFSFLTIDPNDKVEDLPANFCYG